MDIDPELLAKVKNENPEFKKLHEEHILLNSKVDDLNKRKFLTPEQEMEKKTIQKKKLKNKDRMAEILSEHHAGLS
ncbi:MAG: DUF465 domain-containing protein [Nitrospinales bacterium]